MARFENYWKLVKERAMPGTDGRCGFPSLNTRGCSLDFRQSGAQLVMVAVGQYADIPFAVFAGFNHGTIINRQQAGFDAPHCPGTLAVQALTSVEDLESYDPVPKHLVIRDQRKQ